MGKCPLECEMIDHHQNSVKSVNFYPSQHCWKSFNITLTTPHTHPRVQNSPPTKNTQQNNKNTPNKQPIPRFIFFSVCDNFPLFHKQPTPHLNNIETIFPNKTTEKVFPSSRPNNIERERVKKGIIKKEERKTGGKIAEKENAEKSIGEISIKFTLKTEEDSSKEEIAIVEFECVVENSRDGGWGWRWSAREGGLSIF